MPEGDTIHRSAASLHAALAGARLVRFEAPRWPGARPRPGDTIERVDARGKHLLVRFGGGSTLRTHLGMRGSWHLYRRGDRWRRVGRPRVVLETDNGWEAVCFGAPDVEVVAGAGVQPAAVAGLGPDLCRPEVDLDEVVARLRSRVAPEAEVAQVLLDQAVAAGIGNVYKSEVCFACRIDPFTPVGDLDDAALRQLYAVAHRLLRANLGGGRRRTHGGGLAVYGKPGRSCPRCTTPIRVARQGVHARTTYWCPGCQIRPATA